MLSFSAALKRCLVAASRVRGSPRLSSKRSVACNSKADRRVYSEVPGAMAAGPSTNGVASLSYTTHRPQYGLRVATTRQRRRSTDEGGRPPDGSTVAYL